MLQPFGKILILFGFIIIGIGVLLLFADKIPLIGKLPGDINIKKDNYRIFIPITTSILISIIISGIFWLLSFFSKK
ncbi:MAG: DUF2905 domain-containing protein [Chlorobiaceae bacterium]|nr:DUF2905 domain-containing protein [Chlorobiaceae bacterium]